MEQVSFRTGTRGERGDRRREVPQVGADLALILLQIAASEARIGPFATRGRATPGEATRLYRQAACRR